MTKRPLGFLTIPGLLAGLAVILIVSGVGYGFGGVLFSPGGLNATPGTPIAGFTSHAEFIGRCSACHAFFWQSATMADRCMVCHTDVAAQQKDPLSLHGSLLKKNNSLTCRTCHPDHRGPSASLTDLSKANLTHEVFGYSLSAHSKKTDGSPFTCRDCHTNGYNTKMDQSVCLTCHQQLKADFMQAHQQAYGDNCLACHDGVDTYGHAFDHARVAFPLTGKHTQLDCAACHKGAHSLSDLKSTPQDCNACHASDDAHQGQLGTDCGACHTTSGWIPANFDHSKSKFPLTGAHATLDCTQCHLNNVFIPLDSSCYACHAKDDAHNGQFGTFCDACHNTTAWLPPTFDHAKSKFPLTGAHASQPCSACHVNNIFAPLDSACYACHAKDDAHNRQFGTFCDACHTTTAWLPPTFDHSKSGFPLTGAHTSLLCSACHLGNVFTPLPTSCYACHAKDDAHNGQFGTDCGTCHTTTAWLPASFDHSKTGFPLTGAHTSLSCSQCHHNNVFTKLDTACYSCHAKDDAHSGQFGTDCGTCHTTSAWLPATFDHSRIGFPLTGAHASLSCSKCHAGGDFSGLSKVCASCHADPAFHAGLFTGMSCDQCHNTSAWVPAQFNQSHPAACNGVQCVGHESASCRDCHPADLMDATCLKCHDSNNPSDGGGD